MPLWEAAFLGVVQGLAEFLPISSSGHLVLFHALFGVREGSLTFDVLLHMGTLVAVLAYFRNDWFWLAGTAIRSARNPDWSDPGLRLIVLLMVATIPGALAGVFFGDWVEQMFHNDTLGPIVVSTTLSVLGVLLLVAERVAKHTRDLNSMRWYDAILIGIGQALALIPGVSRSGATMTTALFLGLRRSDAARFSFLMSAPIIAGAGLVKLPKVFDPANQIELMPMFVGFIFSAVSGYLAIRFLMRYVQTHSFNIFGYYRIGLGLILLAVLLR